MTECMKSIMDVSISCLLPWRKEPSLCGSHTGTSVRVTGPGVIVIKRIYVCVLLICRAEAIGETEGRNELWENEWIKLEGLETGCQTEMQWYVMYVQVERFRGLRGETWRRWVNVAVDETEYKRHYQRRERTLQQHCDFRPRITISHICATNTPYIHVSQFCLNSELESANMATPWMFS